MDFPAVNEFSDMFEGGLANDDDDDDDEDHHKHHFHDLLPLLANSPESNSIAILSKRYPTDQQDKYIDSHARHDESFGTNLSTCATPTLYSIFLSS